MRPRSGARWGRVRREVGLAMLVVLLGRVCAIMEIFQRWLRYQRDPRQNRVTFSSIKRVVTGAPTEGAAVLLWVCPQHRLVMTHNRLSGRAPRRGEAPSSAWQLDRRPKITSIPGRTVPTVLLNTIKWRDGTSEIYPPGGGE